MIKERLSKGGKKKEERGKKVSGGKEERDRKKKRGVGMEEENG